MGQTITFGKSRVSIGAQIAAGGFGSVHLASGGDARSQYALKLEGAGSHGLFAEQKAMEFCGLSAVRPARVLEWCREHKLAHLGCAATPQQACRCIHGARGRVPQMHGLEMVTLEGAQFRVRPVPRRTPRPGD